MTEHDFINDIRAGIKDLSAAIAKKYSLAYGVTEIVLLETLAKTLHEYAAPEMERYLSELSFGKEADPLLMDSFRSELADVLETIPRH